MRGHRDSAPLCPTGHLPRKGGDYLVTNAPRHYRRQFFRQLRNPLHPLSLRAKLRVEGHIEMVEACHALVERLFQIEPELFSRTP